MGLSMGKDHTLQDVAQKVNACELALPINIPEIVTTSVLHSTIFIPS